MDFDELFSAVLAADHTIKVSMHKECHGGVVRHFYLYRFDERVCELKIDDVRETGHHRFYILKGVPDLNVGDEYKIYDDRYLNCYLDKRVMMNDPKVCSLYYRDDIMGAHFHDNFTTFRLFSPIATLAFIRVEKDGIISTIPMNKDESCGIFTGRVQGDLSRGTYSYIVRIDGKYHSAIDPYCYSVTNQSSNGVIVNNEDVYVHMNDELLPPFSGKSTDAIIYEMSVRDMTSDPHVTFANPRKFLGLTEEGVRTINDNKAGLDYIKSLGVTHVQIMPFYDFITVCDNNQDEAYNWGYDPLFYNVPEGSYATSTKDPYTRIIECKKMIAAFHKAGIRVIMDVVYNHVFSSQSSSFERICPNYYFRHNEDGSLSNGTYCGNEFNSNNLMGRKFIIDSCIHWIKEYHIDGLRFDLMGCLDISTINEIFHRARAINPSFIIYGEGWDMPSGCPPILRAKMQNYLEMPNIGFFNDRFRDIAKGKSSDYELAVKGYLTGDTNYIDGFKHVYLGSCIPLAFPPIFLNPSQSINYVECHDNATLFDKLTVSNYYEGEKDLLKRVKLINASVLLSLGVPFIHAGQEFGISKNQVHNSYNAPDRVNKFDYDLMDKRSDMVEYLKGLIAIRKQYAFLRMDNTDEIQSDVTFENLENHSLLVTYQGDNVPFKKFCIWFNPNNDVISHKFSSPMTVIFDENGSVKEKKSSKEITIDGISLLIMTE